MGVFVVLGGVVLWFLTLKFQVSLSNGEFVALYVFRVPTNFTLSSTSSMCGASGISSVRSVPAECSL